MELLIKQLPPFIVRLTAMFLARGLRHLASIDGADRRGWRSTASPSVCRRRRVLSCSCGAISRAGRVGQTGSHSIDVPEPSSQTPRSRTWFPRESVES